MDKLEKEKFWEWCGFKVDGVGIWHCPDGITELGGMPKLDLNNLFKWAVSKLGNVDISFDKTFAEDATKFEVTITDYNKGDWRHKRAYWCSQDSDPAIALFWAIWKMIESERKGVEYKNEQDGLDI